MFVCSVCCICVICGVRSYAERPEQDIECTPLLLSAWLPRVSHWTGSLLISPAGWTSAFGTHLSLPPGAGNLGCTVMQAFLWWCLGWNSGLYAHHTASVLAFTHCASTTSRRHSLGNILVFLIVITNCSNFKNLNFLWYCINIPLVAASILEWCFILLKFYIYSVFYSQYLVSESFWQYGH